MMKFSYLAVLAFIFFGTVWLEIILNARVYRKIKRLILTIVPVVILMVIWDYYAIINNHWFFDPEKTTGIILCVSTIGSFFGSIFSTLILMATIGVHNVIIVNIALL